jgi:hypothetical protein
MKSRTNFICLCGPRFWNSEGFSVYATLHSSIKLFSLCYNLKFKAFKKRTQHFVNQKTVDCEVSRKNLFFFAVHAFVETSKTRCHIQFRYGSMEILHNTGTMCIMGLDKINLI